MKYLLAALFGLSNILYASAQSRLLTDTLKHRPPVHAKLQPPPAYPGGVKAFYRMIRNNLRYPEIAQLVGINARLELSFVINKKGQVTEVTPLNCIGAGCESEAVKALYHTRQWTPGLQDHHPVRVAYTVPIDFIIRKNQVYMRDLKKSRYGFVFDIDDHTYNITDAESILGSKFPGNRVASAMPYVDEVNFPELVNKETYLLKIKADSTTNLDNLLYKF